MTRHPGDPLWLADDVFLVALNDHTGRFWIPHRTLALALAAALLAEPVQLGSLIVGDGVPQLVDNAALPDALMRATLNTLAAEPGQPLSLWLPFLARTAVDAVAGRLVRQRIIEYRASRVPLRNSVSFPVVDYGTAAWRPVRLAKRITDRAPMDLQDLMLCALVDAAGLAGHVLPATRANASEGDAAHLRAQAAQLASYSSSLHEIAVAARPRLATPC